MLTISVSDALLVFDTQPLRQPLIEADEAEVRAAAVETEESEVEDDRD